MINTYEFISFKPLFCFANISAPFNRTKMVLYSKCAYGSQFSGENPFIGCQDIKQKSSLIPFGTPCKYNRIPSNLLDSFKRNKHDTVTWGSVRTDSKEGAVVWGRQQQLVSGDELHSLLGWDFSTIWWLLECGRELKTLFTIFEVRKETKLFYRFRLKNK